MMLKINLSPQIKCFFQPKGMNILHGEIKKKKIICIPLVSGAMIDPCEIIYLWYVIKLRYHIYCKYWDILIPYHTCPIICKFLFHYLLM